MSDPPPKPVTMSVIVVHASDEGTTSATTRIDNEIEKRVPRINSSRVATKRIVQRVPLSAEAN